jgi:hypothetical protein
MSKDLAELKEKAAQLPEPERAALALSLIESLDGPADEGVEEAWAREIERHIGEIERELEETAIFCVAYQRNEDSVIILAVAHQKRCPGYWRKRR